MKAASASDLSDLSGFGSASIPNRVKDVNGQEHDIVVPEHNVAQVRAQLEAYGFPRAFRRPDGRQSAGCLSKLPDYSIDHEFVIIE